MLAVETSERMVHRALMARVPEALEASLHPDATRAVAKFLEVAAFFGAEPAEESGEASEDDSDESESDESVPEFLYAFSW